VEHSFDRSELMLSTPRESVIPHIYLVERPAGSVHEHPGLPLGTKSSKDVFKVVLCC
jgi:hypothetical protein